MSRIISKSKIEWCDYSWSPYVGCKGDCTVESCGYQCYWKSFYQLYGKDVYPELKDHRDVTFIERNFEKDLPKKPSRIFVNPFSDPHWWNDGDRMKIFKKIQNNPQHQFILLSKFTWEYHHWALTIARRCDNLWCGITVNKSEDMDKQKVFEELPGNITFLSLEPIKEEIPLDLFNPKLIDWLIIGGQTGPGEKFYPGGKWVGELWGYTRKHDIPTFFKDNFKMKTTQGIKTIKEVLGTKIQEWPEVKNEHKR